MESLLDGDIGGRLAGTDGHGGVIRFEMICDFFFFTELYELLSKALKSIPHWSLLYKL